MSTLSKKVLTWFLDLLTRLAHPGSVGPQFFLTESFSPRSIYPESEKKVKKSSLEFFGGATPSDPPAQSGSVEPQFF
jgi:hypothetical protein